MTCEFYCIIFNNYIINHSWLLLINKFSKMSLMEGSVKSLIEEEVRARDIVKKAKDSLEDKAKEAEVDAQGLGNVHKSRLA